MANRLLYSMEKTDVATKIQRKNTQIFKEWIPNHVIEGILLKLPPKSLVRFKCLSKLWHCTINSPYFSRAHLQKNKTNPPLIVTVDRCTLSQFGLDNAAVHNALTVKEHLKTQCELTGRHKYLKFESGCDGILCMTAEKRTHSQIIKLVLWNPSIRKHKILTVPEIDPAAQQFGIGYDPSIDDYKILKFARSIGENPGYFEAEVFELKSNQWRRVSYDLRYAINYASRPVSVKGVMYWRAYFQQEFEREEAIVCFDLANETFCAKLAPIGWHEIEGLLEVEGKLGCCCRTKKSPADVCYDVWVMEDQTWVNTNTFNRVSIGSHYAGDRPVLGWPEVDRVTPLITKVQTNWMRYSNQSIIWCPASLISFD